LQAVQQGRIINIPFAEVNSGNGRALDALSRLAEGRLKYR
jgi:iron complex transport system substrate-binding protein